MWGWYNIHSGVLGDLVLVCKFLVVLGGMGLCRIGWRSLVVLGGELRFGWCSGVCCDRFLRV